MKVTTDDAFVAKLNGSQVAAGSWPSWSSVQTASPRIPSTQDPSRSDVDAKTNDREGPEIGPSRLPERYGGDDASLDATLAFLDVSTARTT
jgi:hypothetical protein